MKHGNLAAKGDLKPAEADLAFAKSRTKTAEASFEQTQELMGYATIKARFDGRISFRGIDVGDFAISAASSSMEAPLSILNHIDRLRIVFDAPESTANQVEIGQKIELKVNSVKDGVFQDEIKRTTSELDQLTRTPRIEAEVVDGKSQLRPGMFGTITVTDTTQKQENKY